jgi:hypothetical protein
LHGAAGVSAAMQGDLTIEPVFREVKYLSQVIL